MVGVVAIARASSFLRLAFLQIRAAFILTAFAFACESLGCVCERKLVKGVQAALPPWACESQFDCRSRCSSWQLHASFPPELFQ